MRDIRVLELAGSVGAAYCGHVLAATGADVVLVEPAGGAPTRRLGRGSPTEIATLEAHHVVSDEPLLA